MATDAIEKYITRYDRAVQGKSKELRLTMAEAKDLLHEISIILGRSATLANKVIDLQDQLIKEKSKESEGTFNIDIDGGEFE